MIKIENLSKVYPAHQQEVYALDRVSLHIRAGEFVSIVGRSGSGKTTLMNIMGCLDFPTGGAYFLHGRDVSHLGRRTLADIRNRQIGFVFQHFHLIDDMSALDNVEMPLVFGGHDRLKRREIARQALELVGLGHRLDHHPSELSGGQQQRTAIARALVNNPDIILADEPTGNLDQPSAIEVINLLHAIHGQGKTIVLITHDPAVAAQAERTLCMEEGRLRGA